jgi:hypothetical protein
MMNKKFLLTVGLILFISNIVLAESCRDQVVVLTDEKPVAGSPTRITMFLDCHASNDEFPEVTTLNYFTFASGKFCQSHRVCGNVKAWKGSFRVGAKWYFDDTFGGYYNRWNDGEFDEDCDDEDDDDNRYSRYPYYGGWGSPYGGGYGSDVGGSNVYGEFKISFEKIDRYCGGIQSWECVEAPRY